MTYFESIETRRHEAVFFSSDPESGLRAITGIHDTTLGPALGGCRMKPYISEEDAFMDALRLSRAMTYKSSMAGLNLGGGKTVVMLDDPIKKTPELLKALAERINLLQGTYIGAGDVGSDTHDLRIMRQYSPWIVGLAKEDGGLGDSAILTSLGVFMGIRAAVKERLGRENMDGLKVAVQGVGKVGFLLIEHLLNAGCNVIAADPNAKAVEHVRDTYPSVEIGDPQKILTLNVDVVSPNAIGGVITAEVAAAMQAPILAGGANNPLAHADVGHMLHTKNILYAPDFVINAGGLIMVACELENLSFEQAKLKIEAIYDTTRSVFEYAKQRELPPWEAARLLAVKRIQATREQRSQGETGSTGKAPAGIY